MCIVHTGNLGLSSHSKDFVQKLTPAKQLTCTMVLYLQISDYAAYLYDGSIPLDLGMRGLSLPCCCLQIRAVYLHKGSLPSNSDNAAYLHEGSLPLKL